MKSKNQVQLNMHNYFSLDLKSDGESSDEEIDESEEEDLQDETVKDNSIIYSLNKKNKTACVIDNENAFGDIIIPHLISYKKKIL